MMAENKVMNIKSLEKVYCNLDGAIENVIMRRTCKEVPEMDNKICDVVSS